MPVSRKISFIFFIYWSLLLYILAALIWWFVALNQQNHVMALLRISELNEREAGFTARYENIRTEERRKTNQYIGEGSIFLLLIVGSAIFIYRAVKRELKQSREQQNFMMAITHELKTPIAVSKLNLETLRKRKLDETQQNRLIQKTLEETNRLNALCNNLLISSQLEGAVHRYTPEEIDLSAMLEQLVLEYRSRYPERVFTSSIDPEIEVTGDPFMLQIVFSNLLDNANKYSSKDQEIEINARKHNGYSFVEISDKGSGIAAAEREKVFQKFYRIGNEATRQAKGTGLGLYLVRKLLNVHRATIRIEANHPHGTIFVIQFKKRSANG
jgi:signal transduction histidine kinase